MADDPSPRLAGHGVKGGWAWQRAVAFAPLGATRSDSARRKPSEISSRTRSVSAFLPGRVSTGPRSFGDVAPPSARPTKGREGEEEEWRCSLNACVRNHTMLPLMKGEGIKSARAVHVAHLLRLPQAPYLRSTTLSHGQKEAKPLLRTSKHYA